MQWAADKIERRAVQALKMSPRNARTHSPEQVAQIVASIQQWGWTVPVLVDDQDEVIAGHGRVMAARQLNLTDVPVVVARGWTEAQIRAYRIADNKLSLNAGWDFDMLSDEMQTLRREWDFDLKQTGFSDLDIEQFFGKAVEAQNEWAGMPEYDQQNRMAFRSIVVHFRDQQAVDDFARVISQPLTDKTKFVWHPMQRPEIVNDKRYAATAFRYGDALPADFEIPSGVKWVLRKDLGGSNPFDQMQVRAGDRVMDCGSCIGTFAAAALEAGAASARCYEPMPVNLPILTRNLARYGERATIIPAALISDDAPQAEMFSSKFPGAHSLIAREKAKDSLTVAAKCFRSEIADYAPNVIKLDVEGAEYDLLPTLRPGDLQSVSCIFIEFHPHAERDQRVAEASAYLESEGLSVVKTRLRAFTALRHAA